MLIEIFDLNNKSATKKAKTNKPDPDFPNSFNNNNNLIDNNNTINRRTRYSNIPILLHLYNALNTNIRQ